MVFNEGKFLEGVPDEEINTKRNSPDFWKEAEQEELKYYPDHITELVEDIKEAVRTVIPGIYGIYQAWGTNPRVNYKGMIISTTITIYGYSFASALAQNREDLKSAILQSLKLQLELLQNKAPKKYETVLRFIDKEIQRVFAPKESVKLNTRRTEKGVATVDKISQSLFDTDKNSPFYELDEEGKNKAVAVAVGKKKGKDVNTAVAINFSELKGVQFSNNYMLDPFARAVHNAMLSIYCAGNKGCSIAQLYRVMYGNTDTRHVPDGAGLKQLEEAVEKLRHTDVMINATDESEVLGYKFQRVRIKNYVMPVKMVEVVINGKKADGFVFLDQPPLYEYARQKGQVNTFDIKNFNVPISAGEDKAVLTNYLSERLQGIRNKKSKMSDVILYDTLYSRLQLDAPTEATLRAKKRDVRKKVKAILDSWKKEGIISDYEEETEKPSNRIRSVKILL